MSLADISHIQPGSPGGLDRDYTSVESQLQKMNFSSGNQSKLYDFKGAPDAQKASGFAEMSSMSRPTEEAKTEIAYMKDSAFTVEQRSPRVAEL